jgi:hypothetical protein
MPVFLSGVIWRVTNTCRSEKCAARERPNEARSDGFRAALPASWRLRILLALEDFPQPVVDGDSPLAPPLGLVGADDQLAGLPVDVVEGQPHEFV